MDIKYFAGIFALFICTSCNRSKVDDTNIINYLGYPENAEIVDFKKTGEGILTLVKEIDIFEGSSIPVGEIVSIDTLGNDVLLADFKQNIVHLIDRETYRYKSSIGSSANDPNRLHRIFGALSWNGKIMVGNAQGSYLLKSFSEEGTLIHNYKNTLPLIWGIANDPSGVFIVDSIAYVVKMIADNGKKVARYKIKDQAEKIEEEIVASSDLHIPLDSADMSIVIQKMFILKSNLKKEFYVVPSNKFLINSYTMDGKLKKSINLMGIPIVEKHLKQTKGYFNSFFSSVAIDSEDNLYIQAQEILAYEAFQKGEIITAKDVEMFILSVNIDKKEYFVNKLEVGKGRALAPLNVFDGKIWCYDYKESQIVVYQLPQK